MPKGIGLNLREEFNELNKKTESLRERTIREINALVEQAVLTGGGHSKKFGIKIEDGPTRVSSWDDEVNEVVIGVAFNHVIIDEGGNESSVELKDVSTETLVDTYCALELEVDNQTVEIEDYSDLIN